MIKRLLPRRQTLAGLAIPLAVSLALPVMARAQTPTRIGNNIDGQSEQPTRSGVADREQAAGVAPGRDQQRHMNNDVEQLNQRIQTMENNDPQVHPHGAGKVDPNR